MLLESLKFSDALPYLSIDVSYVPISLIWSVPECQAWYPTSWKALAYPSKDYRMSNIVTYVMEGTFWTRTRHSRTRCSHPWMSQVLLAILRAEITSCTGSAPTWSAGRFRCLCCSTIYTAEEESRRECWRVRGLKWVLKRVLKNASLWQSLESSKSTCYPRSEQYLSFRMRGNMNCRCICQILLTRNRQMDAAGREVFDVLCMFWQKTYSQLRRCRARQSLNGVELMQDSLSMMLK